jgi:hypothetical protein
MKPFEPEPTANQPGGSQLLDRLFTQLRATLRSLANAVTNDNVVSYDLDTVAVKVFHGLGQVPFAWEVVGLSAGQVVFETTTANPNRDKFLLLAATGPVRASIRFT